MVNLYESDRLEASTGETLRPGGYDLTEKLIQKGNFKKKEKILDLGCGNGATLRYLSEKHKIMGIGIDPSPKLLKSCQKKNPNLVCLEGKGEALPFETNSFDGVLSECSLSLMNPIEKAVKEVYRVLNKGGIWAISDLYAKCPENLTQFEANDFSTCIKKLHNLENLIKLMKKMGFEVVSVEDESHYLKKLMVELVFQYGSMNQFWTESLDSSCSLEKNLKACRPGYFAMLVEKKGE